MRRKAVPMLMEVFGEPAPKPALLQIPGEASMIDVEASTNTLSSGPSTFSVAPSPSAVNVSLSPSKSGKRKLQIGPGEARMASGFEHSIQVYIYMYIYLCLIYMYMIYMTYK